jgi:hypothetical protein
VKVQLHFKTPVARLRFVIGSKVYPPEHQKPLGPSFGIQQLAGAPGSPFDHSCYRHHYSTVAPAGILKIDSDAY